MIRERSKREKIIDRTLAIFTTAFVLGLLVFYISIGGGISHPTEADIQWMNRQ